MHRVVRICAYAGLLSALAFLGHDSYKLYLGYNELRAEEAQVLQEHNEAMEELADSRPEYSSNTEIASAIVKLPACHLQNCYLHLKDDANPVSLEQMGDLAEYTGVEYIEYVIMSDSDSILSDLGDLNIPVNDVIVNEGLIILSVPSLEI